MTLHRELANAWRAVCCGAFALCVAISANAAAPQTTTLQQSDAIPHILRIIRSDYVSSDLIVPRDMLTTGLEALQRAVPEILANENGDHLVLTVGQATKQFSIGALTDLGALWTQLKTLFAFIDANYHGTTKQSDIEHAAVEGILDSLDPHSNLLRPKDYAEFKVGTKGNFGGIGIVIGSRDGQLTVISPIDGTPAARAGLKAQDRITQINDDSTVNMTLNEAVERLRGRVGTSVALTVERTGRSAFPVSLKRAIIEIDSVQSTLLTVNDKQIGFIKIKSFQENTYSDLQKQLAALHEQAQRNKSAPRSADQPTLPKFFGTARTRQLDGVVLDLRNNPGGLLDQAIKIGDLFLKSGVIVSTVGSHGRFVEESAASAAGTEPPYPIVALINEGSASASEIVAGAFQLNQRALLMGARSFGKGSVQTVYDLPDGSALKMTIAEYLTGGRKSIQEIGITPDIELLPVTVDAKRMNLIPDIAFGEKDLKKHLKKHAVTQGESAAHLHYLMPASEDDPDAQDTKAYSKTLDLKDDFPATFAAQYLAQIGQWGGTWGDAAPLLTSTQAAQDAELTKQLSAQTIDWRTGPANGTPQLALQFHIEQNGKRVDAVTVGQEIDLVFHARNTGTGAFYRLRAQTKTDEHLLANRELIIGYLPAGGEVIRKIPLKGERYLTTESIPIALQFDEANRQIPDELTALIPIQGLARPRFALSYKFGALPKQHAGKGLPVGTSIPLLVQIKNIGDGPSQEAVVTLRNGDATSGLFIESGRAKLGTLAPGQTADATLKFHTDNNLTANQVTLELTAVDSQILEATKTDITLTTATSTLSPTPGQWYQAPAIIVGDNALPDTTEAESIQLHATVTDDQQVSDYFVFVGDKKVFYQANPKQSNSVPLVATLPLKPGANQITIAARDQDTLTSRIPLSIYRTTAGQKTLKPE